MVIINVPFTCFNCQQPHQFVLADGEVAMNPLVCSCGEEFYLDVNDEARIITSHEKAERKVTSFRKKSASKARRAKNEGKSASK